MSAEQPFSGHISGLQVLLERSHKRSQPNSWATKGKSAPAWPPTPSTTEKAASQNPSVRPEMETPKAFAAHSAAWTAAIFRTPSLHAAFMAAIACWKRTPVGGPRLTFMPGITPTFALRHASPLLTAAPPPPQGALSGSAISLKSAVSPCCSLISTLWPQTEACTLAYGLMETTTPGRNRMVIKGPAATDTVPDNGPGTTWKRHAFWSSGLTPAPL
mmetsp:Transcript_42937/g.129694  ORF Transcript_42937/g.129694 Transcript_42937/m.129694 type:complete len:216 (+) Transcript_42937:260-907(+)